MPLGAEILADAPIGYWPLTETSGTTATNAGSTAGLNGTLTAGVTVNQDGVQGKSMAFNGSSGYIDIPQAAFNAALSTSAFTIEAWVRNNLGASGERVIFRNLFYGNEIRFSNGVLRAMWHDTANTGFYVYAGGVTDAARQRFSDDRWHHVAFTWNNVDGAKLYVDGGLVGSSTEVGNGTAHFPGGGSVRIGADGTTGYFLGRIAHVAYYNTALSASRISVRQIYMPFETGWKSAPAAIPAQIYYGHAFNLGGQIYLAGGYDGTVRAQTLLWDPATGTTTTKANMPQGRYWAAYCSAEGKGYIQNGYNPSSSSTNTNYQYDPVTNTWTTLAVVPVTKISGSAVSGLGPAGRTYVWNGAGGNSTWYRYDIANNSWTNTNVSIHSQYGMMAAYESGYIWIYYNNGLYRMDPITNAYQYINAAPNGRERAIFIPKSGKIYLAGGSNYTSLNIFDIATLTWSQGTAIPYGNDYPMGVLVGSRMYFLGGTNLNYWGVAQMYQFPALEGASQPMKAEGRLLHGGDGRAAMKGTGTFSADGEVEFAGGITAGVWKSSKRTPIADGTAFPPPIPALFNTRANTPVVTATSGSVFRQGTGLASLTADPAEDGVYWTDWEAGPTGWMRWRCPATGVYQFDSLGSLEYGMQYDWDTETWSEGNYQADMLLAVYLDGADINAGSGTGEPYYASWAAVNDDYEPWWWAGTGDDQGVAARVDMECIENQVYNIFISGIHFEDTYTRIQLNWGPVQAGLPAPNYLDRSSSVFATDVGNWVARSGCTLAWIPDDGDGADGCLELTATVAGDISATWGPTYWQSAAENMGIGLPVFPHDEIVLRYSVKTMGQIYRYTRLTMHTFAADGNQTGWTANTYGSDLEENSPHSWQRAASYRRFYTDAVRFGGLEIRAYDMEVGDKIRIDRIQVGDAADGFPAWDWSEPLAGWHKQRDLVGLTDSVASTSDLGRIEPIGMADSRAMVIGLQITDTVGAIDESIAKMPVQTVVDSLGNTDSSAATAIYSVIQTDTQGSIDSSSQQRDLADGKTDSAAILDTVTQASATSRVLTDGLFGISETFDTGLPADVSSYGFGVTWDADSQSIKSDGAGRGWYFTAGSRFEVNGDFSVSYDVKFLGTARDIANFAFWINNPGQYTANGFMYRLDPTNNHLFSSVTAGSHGGPLAGVTGTADAFLPTNVWLRTRLWTVGNVVRSTTVRLDTGATLRDVTLDLTSYLDATHTTSGVFGQKHDGAASVEGHLWDNVFLGGPLRDSIAQAVVGEQGSTDPLGGVDTITEEHVVG